MQGRHGEHRLIVGTEIIVDGGMTQL